MMRCVDPPLVLLHGFTQTRQSWRRTARALAGRYRAVIPDLPGHGQAVHRTASFDACAAYVRALGPSTLVGYSMGGRIALYTALTVPVKRLVLVGASPGSPIRPNAPLGVPPMTRWRTGSRRSTSRRSRREWGSQPLFDGQPERVAAAAYADRLRNTPAGARGRAARPGDGRDGAAVGAARRADDPGDAHHRRARREVPRARRTDARATTRRAARRRSRAPATRRS